MEDKKDIFERNRPSDKGIHNDPYSRDESAPQPGVNTMSSSKNDDANQRLTKTASDKFDADTDFGKNADPTFDEVDKRDDL